MELQHCVTKGKIMIRENISSAHLKCLSTALEKRYDLYPDMLQDTNVQRSYKPSLDKQLRGSLNDRLMAEMSLQHPLCCNEIFVTT